MFWFYVFINQPTWGDFNRTVTYKNAKALENVGAAKLITEDDFSYLKVISEIDKILNDSVTYQKMKENSLKLGVSDSATRIYQEIRKIIEDEEK